MRDFLYRWTKWHKSWCGCLLCRIVRWLDQHDEPKPPSGMMFA